MPHRASAFTQRLQSYFKPVEIPILALSSSRGFRGILLAYLDEQNRSCRFIINYLLQTTS
jgi:hypothetical protein